MNSYMVSVIIPVYNLENVLDRAMGSLLAQSFPFDRMEVIIVDDGSDDNSPVIEKKWAERYENVKVLDSGGKGVSCARNAGIREAVAKYILFLDGDDLLSEETVENLVSCYESWGDHVDMITYPLRSYRDEADGEKLPDHYRYDHITKTGIYDLYEYPFITQTTMNIMVKNRYSQNIMFRENMTFTEDQAYCFEVLKKKFRIGFCAEAEYKYIRTKSSSSYIQMGSKFIFEGCMSFWEKLFDEYGSSGEIPSYVQAAYINDIAWKTRANVLYPYEKRDEDSFLRSKERIMKLMDKVSDKIIKEHPGLDNNQKAYIFSLKTNTRPQVICGDDGLYTVSGDTLVFKEAGAELYIKRIRFEGDTLVIRGVFMSPSLSFIEAPSFFRKIISGGVSEECALDVTLAAESWNGSHTKTNVFWAFEDRIKIKDYPSNISYLAMINGRWIKSFITWGTKTPFYERPHQKKLCNDSFSVSLTEEGDISIRSCGENERSNYLDEENRYYEKKHPDLAFIRSEARKISERNAGSKSIWLYYDCRGAVDNGFIQFLSDLNRKDGVERYYVYHESSTELIKKYDVDKERLLLFGEHRHQILFLCCDKIITAFIEDYNLIPFSKEDHGRVADMLHHEYTYVQHGVIHAYVPWKYMWIGNEADKVAISSSYEYDLFRDTYNYPENNLILSNMPRFSKNIKKDADINKKYILYAPSWRSWLVYMDDSGEWQSSRKRFEMSDFKKALDNIFYSEKLQKELEMLDAVMYVQLHPIMYCYEDYIKNCENDRIRAAKPGSSYRNCSIFITDYSSYVFDFVNRKTPIIYYFADEDDFYGGLNGYYRLSLPLEEGFGNICRGAGELSAEIVRIADNNWQPDDKYSDRMDGFFYKFERPEEMIYTGIMRKL